MPAALHLGFNLLTQFNHLASQSLKQRIYCSMKLKYISDSGDIQWNCSVSSSTKETLIVTSILSFFSLNHVSEKYCGASVCVLVPGFLMDIVFCCVACLAKAPFVIWQGRTITAGRGFPLPLRPLSFSLSFSVSFSLSATQFWFSCRPLIKINKWCSS